MGRGDKTHSVKYGDTPSTEVLHLVVFKISSVLMKTQKLWSYQQQKLILTSDWDLGVRPVASFITNTVCVLLLKHVKSIGD